MAVGDKAPKVASDAFIAPSASVVGDVTIGSSSSVWYNAVLRSDKGAIKVGNNTNIQERAVVAPSSGSVSVGNGVTIGASAQLDNCTLQDGCMVGVGVQVASGLGRGVTIIVRLRIIQQVPHVNKNLRRIVHLSICAYDRVNQKIN